MKQAGLPRSGKISGKPNFFQVRGFCGWPGNFGKDLES